MPYPGKPVERCAPTLHTNARPSVCVHISLFYRVPLAAFLVFFLVHCTSTACAVTVPSLDPSPSSRSIVSLLRTAIHSFQHLDFNLHLLCIQAHLIRSTSTRYIIIIT
ncbi:hypothetical protein J1614_011772 [Plenodomus biglobosus]|nr:hypothetical protein J1614_011772 [Plenodomus biglobosus]